MGETGRVLSTERLVLRGWRASDLAPFAALNADPLVMEHFPAPLTRDQSDALVERISAGLAAHGFGLWAVEERASGTFVGFVGLTRQTFPSPFTPAVEVGWRLARAVWGRGYATEGARAALAAGFTAYGLSEIVSMTATTNLASQAVMRRLGMHRDPAEDFDHPSVPEGSPLRRHVLFRLRREEWVTQRTRDPVTPLRS
ncbi:MAG: GNAT family N-acetyltransferase [Actinomycetes bacterium]